MKTKRGRKPNEISRLEKSYKIKLTELKDGENLFDIANRNTYKLDEANTIIGLNLYDNGIKDISALGTLTGLTNLDVSANQLPDISPLGTLAGLTTLDLRYNPLEDISALGTLTGLTTLYLSDNQLTDISALGTLTGLTTLYLEGNQLTDISALGTLTGLTTLHLGRNQLTDINALGSLTGLTSLFLWFNQLTDISALGTLTGLTTLYLSDNQLTDISALGTLKGLTNLGLSGNQLTDISALGTLTGLTSLNLWRNQLTDISALASLTGLTSLDLSSNLINDFYQLEFIKSLNQLEELTINNNPFVKYIGLELIITENHLEILKNYFQKLNEDSLKIQLPKKVLLLGNHASGKSTFVDYFIDKELKNKNHSTHTLRIMPFYDTSENNIPKAIFYDFGGQDYYHGLYRSFIRSDCFTLLFWHKTTDKIHLILDSNKQQNWNYDRKYWLGQIEYRFKKKKNERENGDHAPLFMIQSYADAVAAEQDVYKNSPIPINEHFFVSLKEKNNLLKHKRKLKDLRESVLEIINEEKQEDLKTVWSLKLINYILEQKANKETPLSEVIKHYEREIDDFDKKLNALKLDLQQLSRKGLILYYDNSETLNDVVWLNPEATIKYIHKNVLKKEYLIKKKGRLSRQEFEKLKLPGKLKGLLLEEKILFYDKLGTEDYIIPNYLPLADKNDANYIWLDIALPEPTVVLKFESFIPFGFINQLICLLGNNKNKKLFWRDDFFFTYKEYRARVKLIFEHLEIHLSVEKKYCLKTYETISTELFNILLYVYMDDIYTAKNYIETKEKIKINATYEDISQELMINPLHNILHADDLYISTDNVHFINRERLNNERARISQITSYKRASNKKDIDLKQTKVVPIDSFLPYVRYNNYKPMKKLFISYSKKDEKYKDEFISHLHALKRQEYISIFNDEAIKAGEKWHDAIQKELRESDFVITLLSSDYFNTEYIQEHEIKIADSLKKKIIPIMIRPVDWSGMIEANYNAPLKAHPLALNKMHYEKGDYIESTIIERDAYWVDIVNKIRTDYFNG